MTTFFVDLWHELREKRLWPVAVGLLAAIVAIPAVLFKPASAPTTPTTVAPPKSATATLPVVAVDAGPTQGSRLEAFNQKNPFKPMKDLAKQAPSTSPSSPSSSSSSSSGTPLGGSPSSSGKASGGSTPTGGTTPSTTPSATPTTPSVQWFHYTADFSFGQPGATTTKFTSAASFSLLPDNQHPTIVFIGVADDHKSAVFFIADAAFTGAGEGKCNAKGAACRFITLNLKQSGNEENFTSADGSMSYDLKLLAIHRENLATGKSGNPKPAPKRNGKTLEATGAGIKMATQTSEGVLPSLIAGGPGFARSQK